MTALVRLAALASTLTMLVVATQESVQVSAAAGGSISTSLTAASRGPVPQGDPFRFTAMIRNTGRTAIRVEITFRLDRSRRTNVPFLRDIRILPGQRSVSLSGTVVTTQWFRQLGRFEIVALVNGKPVGKPLSFTIGKPRVLVPTFSNVTRAAGLTTRLRTTECGEWAAGAGWADVDGDEDLDLFLPRRGLPAQLWINDGRGRFRDEAAARGVADVGSSAAGSSFADYDNDGGPDLYVFGSGGNRLYRNSRTGVFEDVTVRAGIGGSGAEATSAAWGDYDGDGNLDLYVTYYGRCGPFGLRSFSYEPDRLYHSNGDGTFTDVTTLVEHDPTRTDDGATTGAGFQATWFDYDGDGDLDLYLANDYLGESPDANHLWRNDGLGPDSRWRFTDVSVLSGTAFKMNAMGVAVGDFDRDLRLDVALSNIDQNKLLRNLGDGRFTEVGEAAGIARSFGNVSQRSITWGTAFYDLNLDGWEDLYFAGGFFESPVPIPNELYVNDGRGGFVDLSAPSRADDNSPSRGVAFADYDRDGRVDLYVVNQGTTPRLFRNVTPNAGQHWLEVDIVGTVSNRDGCGAQLIAVVAGQRLVRQVFCGSTSLASWSDPVVHFGLGDASSVSELTIEWPSGATQVLQGVKANRVLTVTEPGARARAIRTTAGIDAAPVSAAGWRPWTLLSPAQLRVAPPLSASSPQARRELTELLAFQAKRTKRVRGIVTRWNERSPSVVWTEVAFRMIRNYRPRPALAARALALLETGMYDAMVAADYWRGRYAKRAAPASVDPRIRPLVAEQSNASSYVPYQAAVAGAAERLLAYLFPGEPPSTFSGLATEAVNSRLWAGANFRSDVTRARELGRAVAAVVIARGESDNHGNTRPPRAQPEGEGYWSPTPIAFEKPIGVGVGGWKPWLMARGDALRTVLPGPSTYGSPQFMAEARKVIDVHAKLTERQKQIAHFWDDGPGTLTPPGHWFQIAIELARSYGMDGRQTARMLALLGATEADAAVAFFDAKYYWWSIRPITTIWRVCDGGGSLCSEEQLAADPGRATFGRRWFPVIPTPPFPGYPSGHSTFSGAAGALLGYFFPDARGSLAELAQEAASSRLYAGIHFDEDNRDGLALGRALAQLATGRARTDRGPSPQ